MADKFVYAHNEVVKRHGSNFCAAPFTSLHQLGGGVVTTCCKTRVPIGNSNTHTYEEIMNSDAVKRVRQQFLANEKPAQCNGCWVYEDQNKQPANNRVFENYTARDVIDLAIEDTASDGTLIKQHPAWLDLLWTNKCNFACVGCSPELSTTIATKQKETFSIINGESIEKYHPGMDGEWTTDNSTKIEYILKYKDSINKIHLNGGEPFMQEDVFELLDLLIENDLHKTIHLWSHTNGSISKYKGVDIVKKYLERFAEYDNCKITISHDGHGARGEYTRWGYKESKWLDTYQRLTESSVDIGVQTCYSLLNALTIEDLGEWYYTTLPKPVYGSLTIWSDHKAFDARLLQLDNDLYDCAIAQLESVQQHLRCTENWHVNLPGHINYMKNKLSDAKLERTARNFVLGTESLDRTRNTKFNETFPELAEFRRKLKRKYNV